VSNQSIPASSWPARRTAETAKTRAGEVGVDDLQSEDARHPFGEASRPMPLVRHVLL
jgi:hypothetical protein